MLTKPWFASRTIVSGIIGFLISILAVFHLNLGPWQGPIVDVTVQLIQAVFAVAALVGVITGRIRADKQIVRAQTSTSAARNVQ